MKVVDFDQEFICFSLASNDDKRVVNISEAYWRFSCLRK